jgi:hypothetical protein
MNQFKDCGRFFSINAGNCHRRDAHGLGHVGLRKSRVEGARRGKI